MGRPSALCNWSRAGRHCCHRRPSSRCDSYWRYRARRHRRGRIGCRGYRHRRPLARSYCPGGACGRLARDRRRRHRLSCFWRSRLWRIRLCRQRHSHRLSRSLRPPEGKTFRMIELSLDNSVRSLLKRSIAQLREADIPSFTLAAELLLLHVLGRDRTWLYAHPEELVADAEAERFFALIARRAAGEPTQHLTGKQEFWGLEFEVTPDVLIPRPETEHLIEVALDRLALRELRAGRPQKTAGEGLQIADIGTGSGCIAIALAKELPAENFVATDISPAALAVAKRNAARHSVADRIDFIECNLLEALDSPLACPPWRAARLPRSSRGPLPLSFDLITSNPPYI